MIYGNAKKKLRIKTHDVRRLSKTHDVRRLSKTHDDQWKKTRYSSS